MFNNIGGKIKVLAKVICWIGIIFSVISGIVIMTGGRNTHLTVNGSYFSASSALIGILTIVVGCLVAWIGSFFAYGFGQLIENSDIIRNNLQRKE